MPPRVIILATHGEGTRNPVSTMKKPAPQGPLKMLPQSGADLREWRLAVGLWTREVVELIGVSQRSVERAERSAQPRGRVLEGYERIQIQLVQGRLNVCRIIRRRWLRRATKTTNKRHPGDKKRG